jgi:hypothetical protein
MNKKLWLYASVATVALMGCASTQERMTPTGCTPGICKVEITIAANCGFTITPDPLPVPVPRGTKIIEWQIQSNDFVFRADGIVVKLPDGEFDAPNLSSNRKTFRLNNKHSKSGKYFYWINVEEAPGLKPLKCSIDPLIVNE